MGGLLAGLLYLLLKLRDLRLGLVQGNVLHQHRLSKDVECVGVGAQLAAEHIFRVGVLFLELGLVDAIGQLLDELLFLRGHRKSLRQRGSQGQLIMAAASPD